MAVINRIRQMVRGRLLPLWIVASATAMLAALAPGAAVSAVAASGATTGPAPTEHRLDIELISDVPLLAAACHDSDGSAVNFGEGGTGQCVGNYYSISAFAVPPFMGPTGKVGGVLGWKPGKDNRLDITLTSSFGGPPATNGMLTGWIASRSSGELHITGGDVPVWHAVSTIESRSALSFSATAAGGPFKHDYYFRITGSLFYAEDRALPATWHHITADVDMGPNCENWGIGNYQCGPILGGQFKTGNTPGLIGVLTLSWRQEGGQIVTTLAATEGGDFIEAKTPSRNSDRFVLSAWRLPSLHAVGNIGQGGTAAPGSIGGPFKIDAENPSFGDDFLNISGWMFYSSNVPSEWPPR